MRLIFAIIFYLIGIYSLFIDNATRLNLHLLYWFWIFYFLKSGILINLKGQKLIFFIILTILYFIPSISILNYYNLDLTYILFIVIIFTDLINNFQ